MDLTLFKLFMDFMKGLWLGKESIIKKNIPKKKNPFPHKNLK